MPEANPQHGECLCCGCYAYDLQPEGSCGRCCEWADEVISAEAALRRSREMKRQQIQKSALIRQLREGERAMGRLANLAYKLGHSIADRDAAGRATDIGDFYLQAWKGCRRMKRLMINNPFSPVVDSSRSLCFVS